MLDALRALHDQGYARVARPAARWLTGGSCYGSRARVARYIHRDVKPANFTIGYGVRARCVTGALSQACHIRRVACLQARKSAASSLSTSGLLASSPTGQETCKCRRALRLPWHQPVVARSRMSPPAFVLRLARAGYLCRGRTPHFVAAASTHPSMRIRTRTSDAATTCGAYFTCLSSAWMVPCPGQTCAAPPPFGCLRGAPRGRCVDATPAQEARNDKNVVLRMKQDHLDRPSDLTQNVKLPPEVRQACIATYAHAWRSDASYGFAHVRVGVQMCELCSYLRSACSSPASIAFARNDIIALPHSVELCRRARLRAHSQHFGRPRCRRGLRRRV